MNYDSLHKSTQAVLNIPMFLDLWLVKKERGPIKKSGLLGEFIKQTADIPEEDLSKLEQSAFEIYRKQAASEPRLFSLFFKEEELQDYLSDVSVESLKKADLLLDSQGTGDLRFRHQVFHDYLAARHVARTSDVWNYSGFDALSWDGKNLEGIYLALDSMDSYDARDMFMQSIYDWFYPAALFCLREDEFFHEGLGVSKETHTAVLASVALKQLDFYPHSRSTTNRLLEGLPPTLTAGYTVNANKPNAREQIFAKLEMESETSWYEEWKDLITGQSSLTTLEKLKRIFHNNPFIGWGAANSLRECKLEEKHWWWTGGALFGGTAAELVTALYRLVHVLGVAESAEAVTWLMGILDEEDSVGNGYHWVMYGAVRSLMEIAAKRERLAEQVFQLIKERASTMPRLCCYQLSRSVVIDNPSERWLKLSLDLLRYFKKNRASKKEQIEWDSAINMIRERLMKGDVLT
jgi:hypothetical protein